MTSDEIVRLTSTTNAAVVQLPERKQPGVVIQGDSLKNLRSLLNTAIRELDHGNVVEAGEILTELHEIVQRYVESLDQATSLVERR